MNVEQALRDACADRIRELEAELNEQARVNGMGGSREAALLAKVARLEKALREIAVGLTAEDAVAGFSQRYQLCAGRLCKIARDALTAAETKGDAWIDDGAGGIVNLGMALSKIGIEKPDKCANCGHSAKSHAADNGHCACGSCICFIPFTVNRGTVK